MVAKDKVVTASCLNLTYFLTRGIYKSEIFCRILDLNIISLKVGSSYILLNYLYQK